MIAHTPGAPSPSPTSQRLLFYNLQFCPLSSRDSLSIFSMADPLILLRNSIAQRVTPILKASDGAPTASIAHATHIEFPSNSTILPLDVPTRFTPRDAPPIPLRSIYFMWLKKDASLPDYIAATQAVNEEAGPETGGVQNLSFAQKVDLVSWLLRESEYSDFIRAADGPSAGAASTSAIAHAASVPTPLPARDAPDSVPTPSAGVHAAQSAAPVAGAQSTRQVDPRLLEIYQNERSMGDHNTILWGCKALV